MFTTQLTTAVNSADQIVMDGYMLDDDMVELRHPEDAPSELHVDLSQYKGGGYDYEFPEQAIEVDEGDGTAIVKDVDGESYTFRFLVTRPLVREDMR